MNKLNKNFYLSNDVVSISKSLIGKVLVTNINQKLTSGIITETEAYAGITDKASHAYNNRRTLRTETMYCEGGVSYVYLCYGMHSLFNIVTNNKDIPHAVLIRAINPLDGIDIILERRGKNKITKDLCNGPGKITEALGIKTIHNNFSLLENIIWIEDRNINIDVSRIEITPRIGIDYAGEDAKLPYRFLYNY